MDTGSEERERGVTVDIAQHHFSTENVDFTILDAPGHRDFVPNMIGGTSMADFAVLVVDANQLDSGMKGQTKEHILLARAVGLQRIVVAVNKLDSATPAWSQDTFSSVSREIQGFLRQEGFTENDVAIVPCSGLHGDNVAKAPSASETTSWIRENHLTLLNHLEASLPPPILKEQIEKPFRMQITDVFRGGITNPLSVAGRIASGNIQVGEAVVIQPSGETASVKAIEVSGDGRDWAVAGDLCNLHLVDIDPQYLRSGDSVCNASTPARNVKTFEAKVAAIDSLLPQGVDIHVGRLHVPGLLSQLVNVLNDQDELIKKKPRMIKAGQRATIKVSLDSAVPLEAGTRVVFRSEGSTVAAGTVSTAVA
jgi:elongation factor 1 alpha-like protein